MTMIIDVEKKILPHIHANARNPPISVNLSSYCKLQNFEMNVELVSKHKHVPVFGTYRPFEIQLI